MKRLISGLMALVLCLAVLPVAGSVQAASSDQLTYQVENGEVTIIRCEYDAYGDLIIPDEIDGDPVTAIGKGAFYECDFLTSVTLPAGIRSIGVKAFHGCDQLKSIYFYGDAPVFEVENGMCYDHEENPWDDLDFDFSAEHESGPFEKVFATVYYFGSAFGWDAVTSVDMTGRGCYSTSAEGRLTLQTIVPATLCGTLTAFGEGAVSMELTSPNSYPIALSLADSTYQIQNLIPGSYTLTLSQDGAVTRVYNLTLREGETALDLKIHQPGDLNGDGRYDIGDVARIYAHAKVSKQLSGYELLCADFTGDGKITVGDTAKAYAILQGK